MCDCLEAEDDGDVSKPQVPLALLMERARAVEAGRDGDRVPEALWDVFFGLSSGSIPWPYLGRMVGCRETALAYLRVRPSAARVVATLDCREA